MYSIKGRGAFEAAYRWTSHSMHLWAGLRRKYGQRRARKSEIPESSLLLTSLDWTLRSKVTEEGLNRVSWNSRKAGSNPNNSSSPVQPTAGKHASKSMNRSHVSATEWLSCHSPRAKKVLLSMAAASLGSNSSDATSLWVSKFRSLCGRASLFNWWASDVMISDYLKGTQTPHTQGTMTVWFLSKDYSALKKKKQ